jgi:hypothetical protein
MIVKNSLDVFCEVPCLTERSNLLSGIALQKKWFKSTDKRIIGQYLQKFIDYNKPLFNFLDVTPYLVGYDQNASLFFRTSRYVGSIPLRSPHTGKQIGDFVVTPRFTGNNRYEDYIEILSLVEDEISPEVIDSLPLASGRNFQPPMYLEAVKYIYALDELSKKSWKKFDRLELISREPVGQVNWNEYIRTEYKVENRLNYPCGKNILNEFHKEYSQMRYVFDKCKSELLSPRTPARIKLMIKPKIDFLEDKLYFHLPLQTQSISVKYSDTPIVKKCKFLANKILNFDFEISTAWRVDFAEVFEKFVQHIFKEVAKDLGGRLLSNYQFKGYGTKNTSWTMSHLEPDMILQKNELFVFVDAKYKSHLYNKHEVSEILKNEHRNDLHQILAYVSFSCEKSKFGILCYPSQEIEIREIEYRNPINQAFNNIKILGLPLKKSIIHEAKRLLVTELAKPQTLFKQELIHN